MVQYWAQGNPALREALEDTPWQRLISAIVGGAGVSSSQYVYTNTRCNLPQNVTESQSAKKKMCFILFPSELSGGEWYPPWSFKLCEILHSQLGEGMPTFQIRSLRIGQVSCNTTPFFYIAQYTLRTESSKYNLRLYPLIHDSNLKRLHIEPHHSVL